MASPFTIGPLYWSKQELAAAAPEVGTHTVVGSPSFAGDGKWGKAVTIDALTKYIEVQIARADTSDLQKFSVVWYQKTPWIFNGAAVSPASPYTGGYYGLLTIGNSNYSKRITFGAFYAWSNGLGIESSGFSPNVGLYNSSLVTVADTLYQWAFIVDKDAVKKIRLLIDGVEVISSTSVFGANTDATSYFRFGKRYWSAGDHDALDGLLDNNFIFGYAITDEQAAHLRTNESWEDTSPVYTRRRRVITN